MNSDEFVSREKEQVAVPLQAIDGNLVPVLIPEMLYVTALPHTVVDVSAK